MTMHWWSSTAIVLAFCFAIGGLATLVDVIRRRYGNRRADMAGSLFLLLVLGYIAAGTVLAAFMALDVVEPNALIEYDSQEFLR